MKLFVLEGIKKMCHLEEVLSRKTHISWVTPLTLGWEWFVEHLRQRDTRKRSTGDA